MAVGIGSSSQTGYTDRTSNSDYNHVGGVNDRIYYRPFTSNFAGTIDSLSLYTDASGSANNVKLLVVSALGVTLGSTASISLNAVGLKTSALLTPVVILNATTYWLGFANDGGGGNNYTPVYGNTGITDIPYDDVGNVYANNPPAATLTEAGTAGYFGFLMYAEGTADSGGGGRLIDGNLANGLLLGSLAA